MTLNVQEILFYRNQNMKQKSYVDDKWRECTHCHKYKPFSEYAKHSTNKNWYWCCCKDCYNTNVRNKKKIDKSYKEKQLQEKIIYVQKKSDEYWNDSSVVPVYRPLRCKFYQ